MSASVCESLKDVNIYGNQTEPDLENVVGDAAFRIPTGYSSRGNGACMPDALT